MERSLYRIRIYYSGNEFSWHKQTPDRKFAIYADSLEDAETKFLGNESWWPFDIADVKRDGDTLHVWSPDD